VASELKSILVRYLNSARTALRWKAEGLTEYDLRRPLTPTATNLLGLLKHMATMEIGYFGDVFGRPMGEPLPWLSENAEPNADMWATAEEASADIIDLYERAIAHADATIAALDLDAPGRVPWWGEKGEVTLGRILVHMIAETHRHAGHADIVRELIDKSAGLMPGNDNLAPGDDAWWQDYWQRVESAARRAAGFVG
jgi:uncharacterized damage-inducible protein DinB